MAYDNLNPTTRKNKRELIFFAFFLIIVTYWDLQITQIPGFGKIPIPKDGTQVIFILVVAYLLVSYYFAYKSDGKNTDLLRAEKESQEVMARLISKEESFDEMATIIAKRILPERTVDKSPIRIKYKKEFVKSFDELDYNQYLNLRGKLKNGIIEFFNRVSVKGVKNIYDDLPDMIEYYLALILRIYSRDFKRGFSIYHIETHLEAKVGDLTTELIFDLNKLKNFSDEGMHLYLLREDSASGRYFTNLRSSFDYYFPVGLAVISLLMGISRIMMPSEFLSFLIRLHH